jgi:hypothetical protein
VAGEQQGHELVAQLAVGQPGAHQQREDVDAVVGGGVAAAAGDLVEQDRVSSVAQAQERPYGLRGPRSTRLQPSISAAAISAMTAA